MQKPKIAIIGLGYVGLPLAVEFSKKFNVVGFDINVDRIEQLKKGIDQTYQVNEKELSEVELNFSVDLKDLADCSIFIITVPTPVDHLKQPDLSLLINASQLVGKNLKVGDIVIYESTVYPGCTEEDCVPILEQESNLSYNVDFFCGYSPERISPGDTINTLKTIVKITSGSNEKTAETVDNLYSEIITAGTYKAKSIKVAEAAKAIENAQRDVNISFVNELALIFDRMNIDTNDVLDAASTKWNFLKFRPGLVGGHCIGVDPYYLAYKAERLGYQPQVILSGRKVNDQIGLFVVNKVVKLMAAKGIPIKNSKALILGISFKENCGDTRNSKVVDIYNELLQFGIKTEIYDPVADAKEVLLHYTIKLKQEIDINDYDVLILAVAHSDFNKLRFDQIDLSKKVIFDTKGFINRAFVDARL